MTAPFGTGDFLHYNAQHKLLICLECKYAIQKNAVDSHLLRHKIYRGKRQQLLSVISELELPEPDDVRFPSEPCEPVDGLVVINGYKCAATACGNLYASVKRMRRHWSESHRVTDLPEGYACAVHMQTFFRGTKVRYFEVLRGSSLPGDGNQGQQRSSESVTIPRLQAQPVISNISPGLDLDLEKMRYFHHFMTTTSLTLPAGKQSPVKYWQTDVVSHALNLRWLMFGVLSISAGHLAVLSEDADAKRIHLERSIQFRQGFRAGWNEMKDGCLGESDVADIIGMGARMTCIQRLCIWMSDASAPEPISLRSFVTTLRGCANPDPIRVSTTDDGTLMAGTATQSTAHLATPNTSIRTDVARGILLDHFSNLPYLMAEKLGRPDAPVDFMAVMSAISALMDCCHQAYDANDVETAWMGMEEWLKKVSGRFTELLVTEKSPAALIVFAQWLLLIAMAERFCWFLRGLAIKMLLLVWGELEEESNFQGFLEQLMGWALESV